jgi:hypothetical protein
MASQWETQVTRLIEQGDRVAWDNAQRGLYEDLVSSGRRGSLDTLKKFFFFSHE